MSDLTKHPDWQKWVDATVEAFDPFNSWSTNLAAIGRAIFAAGQASAQDELTAARARIDLLENILGTSYQAAGGAFMALDDNGSKFIERFLDLLSDPSQATLDALDVQSGQQVHEVYEKLVARIAELQSFKDDWQVMRDECDTANVGYTALLNENRDYERLITSLNARIEELEAAQKWQPIETAPKGADVLMGNSRTKRICVGTMGPNDLLWDWCYSYEPTHYLDGVPPLPAPPKEGE